MVSKLDEQTYTSEFESHWVPLSYFLEPHLSKKLSNLSQFPEHSGKILMFFNLFDFFHIEFNDSLES